MPHNHRVSVLAVDDEPDICALTKSFLESSGPMEVDTVCSVVAARIALGQKHYDAIVSDYQMPVEDGIQFLKSLRDRGDDIPFILFTGRGREEVVIEALNNGADSYLQKGGNPIPQYAELEHRIRGLVQRSRTEKAKRDDEERFKQLADSADEWIWEVDEKGLLIYCNQVVKRILGYDPEELIGKVHFFDLKPPENREQTRREIFATFEAKLPIRAFINYGLTKGGEVVLLETNGIPVLDESGRLIGYRGTNKDITQRRLTEGALKESEEQHRAIFEESPFAIELYDAEGMLVKANRSCLELFGIEDVQKIRGFSLFADPNITEEHKNELRQGETVRYEGAFDFEKVRALDLYHTHRSGIIELDVMVTPLRRGEESIIGYLAQIQDITERKRAEDALRESEARLQTLVQTIPDLVWLKDTKGAYISCNSTFERFFGAGEADIVGKTDHDFVDRELADFFLERDRAAMAAGQPTSNEEWITFANDGHRALLETIKSPMYDAKGELVGVLGIGRDITERKRAELAREQSNSELQRANEELTAAEEKMAVQLEKIRASNDEVMAARESLQEREEELNALLKHLTTGVVVHSLDTTILFSNPMASKLLGLSEDQMRGRTAVDPAWSFLREDGTPLPLAEYPVNRFLSSRESFEGIVLGIDRPDHDGPMWVLCSAHPGRDNNSQIRNVVIAFTDITERVQMEKSLRDSEEKFRHLFEMESDALFMIDKRDGHILEANGAAERLYGYSRSEMLRMKSTDFSAQPEETMRAMMGAATDIPLRYHRKKDGSRFPLEITANHFEWRGIPIVLCAMRDITERKWTEEALQVASRKLNLLSSVTRHDVVNQLLVLQGHLALLEREHLNPASKAQLQKIETAAQRISAMIQFTKEYEDLGIKVPVWVSPGRQMADAFDLLHPPGVALQDDTEGIEILADPLVEKVPYNLIDNSVRHGGGVTRIRISAQQVGDAMQLVFEDDGIGIGDEERKHLFERDFGKNHGLGLFLSREILAITGITITETGRPGQGARFEMTVLPGAWRRPQKEQ